MVNQQVPRTLKRKFDTKRKSVKSFYNTCKRNWLKKLFKTCKCLLFIKRVNDFLSGGILPMFKRHKKRRMRDTSLYGREKVFFDSVRKTLFLLRLMGLVPIEGLLNPDSRHTRFTFKSLYTICYAVALSLQGLSLLVVYKSLLSKGVVAKYTASMLMVSSTALVTVSLFHLCRKWTASLTKIESMEIKIPALRHSEVILRRVPWFIVFMIILSMSEHLSFILYTVLMVKNCFLLDDDSGWYLRSYFLAYHRSFFTYIPFSYPVGFMIQIIKTQIPTICTLADVFIVVVTAYLSHRFKDFNRILIETIKNRTERRIPWSELRAHYTRLTILVITVDDLISPLVFSVFLSHLMLICKQIYDVLRKKRVAHMFQSTICVVVTHGNDAVTVMYLFMALSVLLLRSLMVSLMTAHLHTLSRAPLTVLHTAPTSVYDSELQKLMDQVYNSKICLSGLRFFYITRGTVLSMVSTILTYELMLLQIADYK